MDLSLLKSYFWILLNGFWCLKNAVDCSFPARTFPQCRIQIPDMLGNGELLPICWSDPEEMCISLEKYLIYLIKRQKGSFLGAKMYVEGYYFLNRCFWILLNGFWGLKNAVDCSFPATFAQCRIQIPDTLGNGGLLPICRSDSEEICVFLCQEK